MKKVIGDITNSEEKDLAEPYLKTLQEQMIKSRKKDGTRVKIQQKK
ncbi:MAG: hypothetical protein ABJH98_17980 [Reichenbachiella sp.]